MVSVSSLTLQDFLVRIPEVGVAVAKLVDTGRVGCGGGGVVA
jgi:hypothetical protein